MHVQIRLPVVIIVNTTDYHIQMYTHIYFYNGLYIRVHVVASSHSTVITSSLRNYDGLNTTVEPL